MNFRKFEGFSLKFCNYAIRKIHVIMLEEVLRQLFIKSFKTLYGQEPPVQQVNFQKTRPEFEGDMTIVVFPFVKLASRNPEQLANEMGAEMIKESDMIAKFNVSSGWISSRKTMRTVSLAANPSRARTWSSSIPRQTRTNLCIWVISATTSLVGVSLRS